MRNSTYFNKLMKIIDGNGYECLMKKLYSIPFYSDIAHDKNLIDKVIDFRWEIGYVGVDKPSVFEVLVMLSMDIERNIMHKTEAGNRTSSWFWAMLCNLGFQDFDDECYDDYADECIDEGVDILLERTYDRDGNNGGLFIIERPEQDLRRVPLWTQACWWLREKYKDEWRIDAI